MEVLGKNFVFWRLQVSAIWVFQSVYSIWSRFDLIDSFKILDLNSKQVITLVLYFFSQEMGCSSPNSDFGIQVVISCFKVIPSFLFEDWINFFCVVFFCSRKTIISSIIFFRNSFVDCNHEYIFPSFFGSSRNYWFGCWFDVLFFWLVDLFFSWFRCF